MTVTYHQTNSAGRPKQLVRIVKCRQLRMKNAKRGRIMTEKENDIQYIIPTVPRCLTPENSERTINSEALQPANIKFNYYT